MSLIHLKQGIPELFICPLHVFSHSMTTSLTLIKEELGWLLYLPFVLINGGCSAQTQGVSEIKYPAHTERDRANAGAGHGKGGVGKPSVTLATPLLLSFPQYSLVLLPLLARFAPNASSIRIMMLYCGQSHEKCFEVRVLKCYKKEIYFNHKRYGLFLLMTCNSFVFRDTHLFMFNKKTQMSITS